MKKSLGDIQESYFRPLIQLVREASVVHSQYFPKAEIQASSLLSIKTGGCPENCAYCPQSAHYETGVRKRPLEEKEEVLRAASRAREAGASRFCMGAAWGEVRDGWEFDHVLGLVAGVRELGLEVCCTLGMLSESQAARLKVAGLGFYNHNLDTSREYYSKIIQTRTYEDRIRTIQRARNAGIAVCTGGILGMGESHEDRIGLISELVGLDPLPESLTVNMLVPIQGTPLAEQGPMDPLDLVRVVAVLRILAPASMIRLSAGRLSLTTESQFLCFLAGANSIFLGEKLLTSPNPEVEKDADLLSKLGMSFAEPVL